MLAFFVVSSFSTVVYAQPRMVEKDASTLGIAIQLYHNGHVAEALLQLKRLQVAYPKHAQILRYMALSYAALGQTALASKMHAAFLKVIANRVRHAGRDLLLYDMDDLSDAEEKEAAAVKDFDVYAVISLAKAISFYRQGKSRAAVQLLEKLQLEHPYHPRVLRFLALAYEKEGRIGEASRIFALFLRTEAHPMVLADKVRLLQAIEDIQIGDVSKALKPLRELFEIYPKKARLLRHLSLASEELGHVDEAAAVYALWRRVEVEERLAWLGSARAQVKLGHVDSAARVLAEWLQAHPEDLESLRNLAKLYMKLNQDSDAERVWKQLLHAAEVTTSMRAEAYYHLAVLAFTEGNASDVRGFVDDCLQAEDQGLYAQMARDLREMNMAFYPEGLGGLANIGVFYTSNVEMLPDTLQSQQTTTADVFSKMDMTIAWRMSQVMLGYTANAKWYVKRNDYNALYQSAFVSLSHSQWASEFHLDYVMLGNVMLYGGGGVDLSWSANGWIVGYGAVYKSYNKTYGYKQVDYSYLNALNHSLKLTKRLRTKAFGMLSLSLHGDMEQAAGYNNGVDASSYQQFGGSVSWSYNHEQLGIQLGTMVHQRLYNNIDTKVLATVPRKDLYKRAAIDVSWKLDQASKHVLLLSGLWQQNDSNYVFPEVFATSQNKDFTEWEAGLSWRYVW